jgi:hypothetical protein
VFRPHRYPDLVDDALYPVVRNLINALSGNSSVNANRGNNRRETVFSMRFAPSKRTNIYIYIGSLLPGNAAVNMHPQQWETVFSVGSVQRSYLKNKRALQFRSQSQDRIKSETPVWRRDRIPPP